MVPNVRDLSNPSEGPHAMQLLLEELRAALETKMRVGSIVERAHPIVHVEDNYDRLHYPPEGAARDKRYTRYVDEHHVLRTQTTAMIPPLLRRIAAAPHVDDLLLICPGLVYRRDTIDRLHTGEPHQVDLWRIRRSGRLGLDDLREMIETVAHAALPGRTHRTIEAQHPYTVGGLQIDVEENGAWVEIGECGLALPALLEENGLDIAEWSGLAMGLGLDRLLMLRKGIDDIRLLRAQDARIAEQMLDLAPYRAVSMMPPIRRDLSLAVDRERTAEELGDRVREVGGVDARSIEAIEVLSETPYDALPPAARVRIGIRAEQKNVLLRIVLRDLERTLTDEEANAIRDAIYAALHEGDTHQWASKT